MNLSLLIITILMLKLLIAKYTFKEIRMIEK